MPDADVVFRQCVAPELPALDQGDAVLWDSRTVHCVPPPTDASRPRCVAYLSMAPRRMATPETLARRRDYFARGVSTTHWPHVLVDRGDARCRPSARTARDDAARALI